jgi:hypothetical protein
MAVPLHVGHAAKEIDYIIQDSRPVVVVGQPQYTSLLQPIANAYGAQYIELQPFKLVIRSSYILYQLYLSQSHLGISM